MSVNDWIISPALFTHRSNVNSTDSTSPDSSGTRIRTFFSQATRVNCVTGACNDDATYAINRATGGTTCIARVRDRSPSTV